MRGNEIRGRTLAGAGVVCLMSLLSNEARADQPDGTWEAEVPEPNAVWNLTVGAGAALIPHYDGADRYRFGPVPLATLNYRNIVTLGPNGLGYTLLRADGFSVTPILGYSGGRKESADSNLKGLGDIQAAATAGVVLKYQAGAFGLSITPRQAITQTHDGFTTAIAATYSGRILPALRFSVGPTLTVADGQYEQTYFGIDAQQSVRSGKPLYNAGGGIKDVGLAGTLTYSLDSHWSVVTRLADRELVGDAADSPIVKAKNQASVISGVEYHF
jgi:MipA family protein